MMLEFVRCSIKWCSTHHKWLNTYTDFSFPIFLLGRNCFQTRKTDKASWWTVDLLEALQIEAINITFNLDESVPKRWFDVKSNPYNEQKIDFWLLISSALKSEQETEVITRKTRFVIGCIFKMADLVLNSHWSIVLANQDTLHCLPLVRIFRWHYVPFKFWLQNPVLPDYVRWNLWKMI